MNMDIRQIGNLPAYPSHGSMGEVCQLGMSLRDYFAAQALIGLIYLHNYSMEINAIKSYEYADLMIKAREVEP